MRVNPSAHALGLEIDRKLAKIARKNVSSNKNFKVLQGSLISSDQLDGKDLSEVEGKWFSKDLAMLEIAPKISMSQLPAKIDLLVSDGGEFGGFAELSTFLPRCSKFIVLDDVAVRKNARAFLHHRKLE